MTNEETTSMNESEWRRGDYVISTDRARLDISTVHEFLSASSYWARGRSLDTVRRSIEHSLPFGLYHREPDGRAERQVGFARVVTDYATFAWLADVFVLEEFRGHGLGKWLVEVVVSHPSLQNLRRWMLATRDAHGLYRRNSFEQVADPQLYMERLAPTRDAGAPMSDAGASPPTGAHSG